MYTKQGLNISHLYVSFIDSVVIKFKNNKKIFVKGIIQNVSPCIWLLYLSIIFFEIHPLFLISVISCLLLWCSIPFYNVSQVSSLGWRWIKLLWNLSTSVFVDMLSYLLAKYLKSGITGSYGEYIFTFIRKCRTALQSGCVILHSQEQRMRVPVANIWYFAHQKVHTVWFHFQQAKLISSDRSQGSGCVSGVGGGIWLQRTQGMLAWIRVVVTQVETLVKTHWTIHLKRAHFIMWKWYLNIE